MTAAQREAIARRVCVNRGLNPDCDLSRLYSQPTLMWQKVLQEITPMLEVLAAAYECAEERGHMTNQTILASIVRELERQSMVTGQPVGHYGEMWRLVELQGKFDLDALAAAIERDLSQTPERDKLAELGKEVDAVCAHVTREHRDAFQRIANEAIRQRDELRAKLQAAAPLKWSSERPNIDGYWWIRFSSKVIGRVVEVDGADVYFAGGESGTTVDALTRRYPDVQWAGPLKPPEN